MIFPASQDDEPDARTSAGSTARTGGRGAATRLRKQMRLRNAIAITNRAIIRSHSPAEVYRAVCRACVEQTDVKLAWIGVADEAGERLVPVEVAGASGGYLDDDAILLAPENPEGLEPAAVAFRERRAYFCNDLARDVASPIWRERAAAKGLRALIALPLLRGGVPYGMLAAYGPERNFFDPDSAEMLLDMADNISFAIDQFDRAEARRQAEERLRASLEEREHHAERCESLSRRLVALQENERRGLARELHDRANPNLAAIKLILGSVEKALPPPVLETVRPMLLDVKGLLNDTATGIREICADLRPTLLDYTGLVPTLESYTELFMKRTGVPVRLRVPSGWSRLELDVECMFFRVAQEALTNCAKHACARNVEVELIQEEGRRILAVRDDGFGFDVAALGQGANAPGLGLISMRERAEFAGAEFSLASHPMRGTEVRVILQEPAEANAAQPLRPLEEYRKDCSETT
ncbi:MAG TPA: GAF domain-containing sensor histidine kinase [Rhodocyclaceae bacterium]